MKRLARLLIVAALASPAGAEAKAWIGFSASKDGAEVGESFDATLTIPVNHDLQVPRQPELVFIQLDSNVTRRFSAERTRNHGVFRARVSLPRAGTWTVYVYAYGLGSVALPPASNRFVVRAAPRTSRSGGWSGPALVVIALGLLAVGATAAVAALGRQADPVHGQQAR